MAPAEGAPADQASDTRALLAVTSCVESRAREVRERSGRRSARLAAAVPPSCRRPRRPERRRDESMLSSRLQDIRRTPQRRPATWTLPTSGPKTAGSTALLRASARTAHSHTWRSSADVAFYGCLRVLLSPPPAAGFARPFGLRRPGSKLKFGRCTRPCPGLGAGRLGPS